MGICFHTGPVLGNTGESSFPRAFERRVIFFLLGQLSLRTSRAHTPPLARWARGSNSPLVRIFLLFVNVLHYFNYSLHLSFYRCYLSRFWLGNKSRALYTYYITEGLTACYVKYGFIFHWQKASICFDEQLSVQTSENNSHYNPFHRFPDKTKGLTHKDHLSTTHLLYKCFYAMYVR